MYILGIFLVFIQKGVVSLANIFDSQLSRKTFTSIWALVALNGIIVIPLIPILYLLLKPELLTLQQFLIFGLIACIGVFYQIPYYKAMRYADTSVVVSLFGLGKILVPVFAYYIVNERLAGHQYVGFSIIVICSLFASASNIKKFRFNQALWYMLPVAVIISLQSVLQKYGLSMVSWSTFYFWSLIVPIPLYFSCLLAGKATRSEVKLFLRSFTKPTYHVLYIQNIASWMSEALGSLALSLLPVTIIKSIGSFQALFVNLISSKFSKRLKVENQEKISIKRLVLFLLLGAGIILTVI